MKTKKPTDEEDLFYRGILEDFIHLSNEKGKCILCGNSFHFISIKDALRRKPLRELRDNFILKNRSFEEENKAEEKGFNSALDEVKENMKDIKLKDSAESYSFRLLKKIKEKRK